MPPFTSRALTISRAASFLTIALMAWQVELPLNLPQFDVAALPLSYLRPAVSLGEVTAVIACVAYALAGWPNFRRLRTGWRRLFAISILGLILFAALSVTWSIHRGLAAMQTLHLLAWAIFALLIACADWPASSMALALLSGLLIHSAASWIQLGLQPTVGLGPENSGISVVFGGTVHWQRAYGLSPHPNILGGHLAIGLLLTLSLGVSYRRRKRFLWIAAWLILWSVLLLTFSRSAWLALIGGGVVAWLLLRRSGGLDRSRAKIMLFPIGVGLLIVLSFAVWFQPFLANRIDVIANPFEIQSVVERLRSAGIALQIFGAHPIGGAGLAQFVVVARDMLGATIDWVHNVPLLVAADLGVGGLLMCGLMLLAVMAIGRQRWRTRSISPWQALIGGGLIALLIVMQFDHYVWTMSQGGLLGAWLMGWWCS